MRLHSTLALTAALIVIAPLAGCESVGDFIQIFSGKKSAAQRQHEAAARVTGAMLVPPPAVVPDTEAPPQQVAEVAPVAVQPEPEPADPGPPPFECVSIFRVQTCEGGVLYMLDSNMGWILPGRTE